MSGKAVLVLVVGIIIIVGTVMFNIEAASTRIVRNFGDYYQRQTTLNISQAGINLALAELTANRTWRAGYTKMKTSEGTVTVSLSEVILGGSNAVKVVSIGETDFGSSMSRRDTSVVYVRDGGWKPNSVRGLLTLLAAGAMNGNIEVDGRNYDLLGNLIAGTGVPGIWSTNPVFSIGGSATVGGTTGGIDYAPKKNPDPGAIALGQVYAGGFPTTPEAAFSGATTGLALPDGALKAIAQSGFNGSQYVTDPSKLKYPLKGITYVELPIGSNWDAARVDGSGALIVHNAASNAQVKNAKGLFKGLIVADDVVHYHGDLYGGMVLLGKVLGGNVFGNGVARLRYSDMAIRMATGEVQDAMPLDIIAWWE